MFRSGNYILGDGKVEGNQSLFAFQFSASDANNPTVAKGHYPASWQVTPSFSSCTGNCSVTVTVGAGYTGSNNITIGPYILTGSLAGSSTENVLIGYGAPAANGQNIINDVFVGSEAGSGVITTSYSVLIGAKTGNTLSTGQEDVIIGAAGGRSLTDGSFNVMIGSQAAGDNSCLTGGVQQDIIIGADLCLPSATASGQLTIANAIFGYNNTGALRNSSTGEIALFYNQPISPTMTFAVSDGGGTTTYGTHMGFKQTTAPGIVNGTLDANASDGAGTIILTGANPVVTFHIAWATGAHCTVSSPSGTAFTYNPNPTSALTLIGGASGDTAIYLCFQ